MAVMIDASRIRAALGSALFFVAAPVTVAGLIPWLITGWRIKSGTATTWLLRPIGIVLVVAGGAILVHSFVRFVVDGIGTPAPIAPTQHLVVGGAYRFVRNPMYLGVAALILGQALIFASWSLAAYGAAAMLVTHLFVVGYEEPTLSNTFGEEYAAYRRAVRRWIPRLTPSRTK